MDADAPGPVPDDFLWGSLRSIINAGPLELHMKWIREYGNTFRYRILGGGWRFFTADPIALQYILSQPDTFPKPEMTRQQMETFLGNGVLIAEGDDHRRQRKILNPSFSQAAVRDQVPMFLDKAYELKDTLVQLVNDTSIETSPTPCSKEDTVPGTRKIDVMRYLAQATLDVIGLAGFNYDFRSLSIEEGENELAEAYRDMFQATQSIDTFAIMQAFIKPLRWIVSFHHLSLVPRSFAKDCSPARGLGESWRVEPSPRRSVE
jgi:cytochrome P450